MIHTNSRRAVCEIWRRVLLGKKSTDDIEYLYGEQSSSTPDIYNFVGGTVASENFMWIVLVRTKPFLRVSCSAIDITGGIVNITIAC